MQLISRKATAGFAAALALVPATAVAATIDGGPGNERLRGTNAADTINGNAGNDRIFGRAGDDGLRGGPGNDRVFGGDGNDTVNGDAGNDRIAGGTGDDTINGDAGNDLIFANLGRDTEFGGDGNDHLWALARGDVRPGPNGEVDSEGDSLDGGNGNDTFHTRDGEVDLITCGDGNDRALLDTVDVITDATAENPNGSCEKVIRKAPKTKHSRSEDAQQSPADANASH
jgi:Ca2+-binding RTX toxin-like protein